MSQESGAVAQQQPQEQSAAEVYIDRGPELPWSYPGRRARVMVQDPHTLYVYWDLHQQVDRWEVRAEADGEVLHSFQTPYQQGFLRLRPEARGTVYICPVRHGEVGNAEVIITFAMPRSTPLPLGQATWAQAGDLTPRQSLLSQANARSLVSTMEGLGAAPGGRLRGAHAEAQAAPRGAAWGPELGAPQAVTPSPLAAPVAGLGSQTSRAAPREETAPEALDLPGSSSIFPSSSR
ncbi:MAG: hypothetical protein JXX28_08700 [Deltaproteobacteria bacterium]|nr:hypothetical protein [Deltaproteobacteria bacterium]